jgi:small subunit ribosomal protein S10
MRARPFASSGLSKPASTRRAYTAVVPRAVAEAAAPAAATKSKIRVTLKSYEVPLLEEACDTVLMAAAVSGAKASGPVYMPTKKRVYVVLRSPHVNKDSREHFEIRTHKRLIDITNFGAQTVESLLAADLPAGVDIQVEVRTKNKEDTLVVV